MNKSFKLHYLNRINLFLNNEEEKKCTVNNKDIEEEF